MRIQISDHFTVGKLLRFVFPSIIMMIFTSIYGVVDGFFVSNYVGKTPFAAVNLIMPLLMAVGAIGFMLGSGGSALVAKTCGEGDAKRANRYFSMVIYAAVIIGFAAAAYVTGRIANEKSHPGYSRLLAANFIGLFIVYAFGMVYYYVISNFVINTPIGLWPLFLYCFLLAVPGDIVLCLLAAAIGKRMIPMIRKGRLG